jgi:hypothetical protein
MQFKCLLDSDDGSYIRIRMVLHSLSLTSITELVDVDGGKLARWDDSRNPINPARTPSALYSLPLNNLHLPTRICIWFIIISLGLHTPHVHHEAARVNPTIPYLEPRQNSQLRQ